MLHTPNFKSICLALALACLAPALRVGAQAKTLLAQAEPATPAAGDAPAAPVLGPNHETLITIHPKDAKLKDVIADIAQQAGIRIQSSPANLLETSDTLVTMDFDKQPFWQVLHELGVAYDLTVVNNGAPGKQILLTRDRNGTWGRFPSFIAGPVIVSVSSITRQSSIYFQQSDTVQTNFTLQLTGFSDPNAHLLSGLTLNVDEATDDHDNSLVKPNMNNNGGMYYGPGRGLAINLGAQLAYPEKNPGTKIVKLKGTLNASVAVKTESIEFSDMKAGEDTSKSAGDYTVVLHEVKDDPNTHRVTARFTITDSKAADAAARPALLRAGAGGGPANRNTIYSLASAAVLVDTTGRPYMTQGTSSSSSSNGNVEMTLNFGPDYSTGRLVNLGEPGKLTFEIPTETKDISVPIELTDIKMP